MAIHQKASKILFKEARGCKANRCRRQLRCVALLTDGLNPVATSKPFKLTPPEGGADIALFGVIHAELNSPAMADYILQHKPKAVVVETALDGPHGAETGTVVTREDRLYFLDQHDPRSMAFAQYGAQLASFPDPFNSSMWQDLRRNAVSEQLAYIAAFAVDADIVYGDRTKLTTYLRMLHCPSLADLDAAFGFQSMINYAQLAPQLYDRVRAMSLSADNAAERVLMQERDAVMLHSISTASLKAGPEALVVGIVGASHVESMRKMWSDDSWKTILTEHDAFFAPNTNAIDSNNNNSESAEARGVRRALFDGVIRLTCRPEVQADVDSTLGPVPPSSLEAFHLTHELYGTTRMLLACCERDVLYEVCRGFNCDMWDVLEPIRAVRPVNGGPGYDEELVYYLRTLNFDIQ